MATMAFALAPAEVAGQAAGPYNFSTGQVHLIIDVTGYFAL